MDRRCVTEEYVTDKTQTQKGSNECLFILTRHSMQIFVEIPFIKPRNDT